MKHLLTLTNLTKGELCDLLDSADNLEKEAKKGVSMPYLRNKMLGMIFTKSSTKTRVSFETGIAQLDGTALYPNANGMQLGRGRSVKDMVCVLPRYLDGAMIRTYRHSDVEKLTEYRSIPIINGLTDYAHPCQVPADLQMIREHKGTLAGLKMCFIDAGNNMANSLINGGILADIEMACTCPLEYLPNEEITKRTQASGRFTLTQNVLEATKGADVLVTDMWASMGKEQEAAQRRKIFEGIYQINDTCTAMAKADAMALYCLPAHRKEGITEEVFEAHADEIFDEAENYLHVQKAVLVTLLKGWSEETDGETARLLSLFSMLERMAKSNT